jgi:hypothetical protein
MTESTVPKVLIERSARYARTSQFRAVVKFHFGVPSDPQLLLIAFTHHAIGAVVDKPLRFQERK